MTRFLVVDDMAVFREPIAATLRREGYETSCARDGGEALTLASQERPDLILLDMGMPVMDGLACLGALRNDAQTRSIPVIALTAMSEKQMVEQAIRIGVQGYMLKSQFSLDDLLSQVRQHLETAKDTAAGAADNTQPAPRQTGETAQAPGAPGSRESRPPTEAPATATASASDTEPRQKTENQKPPDDAPLETPRSLTRAETLQRIEEHTEAKTLAGNVAEIIALASSPRGDAADLSTALKRDPIIAARVLQAANSAAYSSNKPHVSTIEDAVRNIGFGTIRNVASAVGIFETFPADAADGFNALRCWQHSFAVAAIMDRLLPESDKIAPGVGHLVGLCHDLAEIVLRHVFAEEFQTATRFANKTGRPLHEVEKITFGMSRHEVITLVLTKLKLPAAITGPIREFVMRSLDRSLQLGQMARALRLADYYSHGLQLAEARDPLVGPITRTECRNALGSMDPAPIDGLELRTEVVALTSYLARLSAADAATLSTPPFESQGGRVWYARHESLAALDPLAMALSFLTQIDVRDRLPTGPHELADHQAMIVVAPKPDSPGFSIEEAERITRGLDRAGLPVLYLMGNLPEAAPAIPANTEITRYPIPLGRLAQFTEHLTDS